MLYDILLYLTKLKIHDGKNGTISIDGVMDEIGEIQRDLDRKMVEQFKINAKLIKAKMHSGVQRNEIFAHSLAGTAVHENLRILWF